MFLIRGIFQALAAILNPLRSWQRCKACRAPFVHALAGNAVQLMIVGVVIDRCIWSLERVI